MDIFERADDTEFVNFGQGIVKTNYIQAAGHVMSNGTHYVHAMNYVCNACDLYNTHTSSPVAYLGGGGKYSDSKL